MVLDDDIGIEARLIEADVRTTLDRLMLRLSPRRERVLRLRFGLDGKEPRTLREIAKDFGLSPENIRVIEAKAMRGLLNPKRVKKLANAGSVLAENYLRRRARALQEYAEKWPQVKKLELEADEKHKHRAEAMSGQRRTGPPQWIWFDLIPEDPEAPVTGFRDHAGAYR